MNLVGYSISFFVSWWLILFLVLPFGVTTHSETGEKIEDGIEVGSPIEANIKQKMLITTALTVGFIVLISIVDYLDLIKIN